MDIKFRELNGGKEKKIDLSNLTLKHPNLPNNCLTLDLQQIINGTNNSAIKQVKFKFRKGADVLVEIEDRLNPALRGQEFMKFNVEGPSISLKKEQNQVYKYYSVKFHQEVFVENDPSNECISYPTKEYSSYAYCDSEFVKRFLATHFPKGFMPIWATHDEAKVTKLINLKGLVSEKDIYDYKDIMTGTTLSDCPLHCQRTKTKTVFTEEKFVKNNFSQIYISFYPTVSIEKTDFPKFEVANYLSSLGGSMGFWLGLGIMQTIELMIEVTEQIGKCWKV